MLFTNISFKVIFTTLRREVISSPYTNKIETLKRFGNLLEVTQQVRGGTQATLGLSVW